MNVELRQGCVMSSQQFNMYMDGDVGDVNARVQDDGLPLADENGSG